MAVFDATTLIHLLEPSAPAVKDPSTGEPVPRCPAPRPTCSSRYSRREGVVFPTIGRHPHRAAIRPCL